MIIKFSSLVTTSKALNKAFVRMSDLHLVRYLVKRDAFVFLFDKVRTSFYMLVMMEWVLAMLIVAWLSKWISIGSFEVILSSDRVLSCHNSFIYSLSKGSQFFFSATRLLLDAIVK